MANQDHLRILRKGAETWNQWRSISRSVVPDLRNIVLEEANLRYADMHNVDLSEAKISNIDFRNANFVDANFSKAQISKCRFSEADFSSIIISNATISYSDFSFANFRSANLSNNIFAENNFSEAKFRESILSSLDISNTDLKKADFRFAKLFKTNLQNSNLDDADFRHADLSYANLAGVRALRTDFSYAVLTGICIEDWNINNYTELENVICTHVFVKSPNEEKRPRVGEFKTGEFLTLVRQALDTVDLIFRDGINWAAFFQSFQELRDRYNDGEISIQAIERKYGGAFIIRLEVLQDTAKSDIEREAKELYEHNLLKLENVYKAELKAKDNEISSYKKQNADFLQITKLLAAKSPTPVNKQYVFINSQFSGGVIDNLQDSQISETFQNFRAPVGNVAGTNYGSMTAYINQNSDDISRLITVLRETAQQFPEDQKEEALMELDDLEADLKSREKQEPKRIGKRLQRLIAAGTAAATIAGGAATFSGDINEFTGNVLELAEKVGLSLDAVQPD